MLKSEQRILDLNAKLAETLTNKGVTASADETTTSLVNKVSDALSFDDSVLARLIDRSIESVVFPDSVTSIGSYAFSECTRLTSITIPDSVKHIGDSAFRNCPKLKSITIPDNVIGIGYYTFYLCSNLTSVIIGDGFNANGLNLSASKLIERETMVNIFNALADRTGLTAYTLTLNKAVADKLTDEDKAIPTAKNWTIVYK